MTTTDQLTEALARLAALAAQAPAAAVQRHLFNRFLGCLYHCLQTRQLSTEERAFPATLDIAA